MSRRPKKKKADFFDKIDESSLTKQVPACKHFPDCGGCRFQHIAYESQLQIKKDYLKNLFGKDVAVVGAQNELEYRNRMDFVYSFGKLGLRKRGDFREVVEINDCLLLPKKARDIFTKIKFLLKEHEISSYDFLDHVGFLRYVTIRFAPNTGESMIIFISASPSEKDELALNVVLQKLKENVTSMYWFISDEITDTAVPVGEPKLVIGQDTITEKIGDVSLAISPQSFFQSNSAVATLMFEEIKKHVHGNVVDLCCGVGAITLFVADAAKSIIGVEEVPEAIVLAKKNATLNNMNALFFTSPMKKFADFAPLEVNTIIVDPPRSGLGRRAVEKILASDPETIIYMSCNPKTQKDDLQFFPKEYEEVFFEGYDMFSQTNHVETLIVLKRK